MSAPETVRITREKLYPSPGRNVRFAWKWLYTVHVPGEPHPFTGPDLSWARGIAKRKGGGRPIVETWKPTVGSPKALSASDR